MARASRLSLLAGLGLLAAAPALAGCASSDADWRERYLEKERDAGTVASQLTEERNARATAVAQLEEAKARIGDLEKENEALKGQVAPTPAAPAAPAPAAAASTAVEDAVSQMKRDGLNAYQTADGNIAIVLPADITFSPGSKDLSPAGRKAVDQIAKELEGQFAGTTVRVEGHTDGDPIRKSKFADNFELGAERSLSVVRYLVQQHKVAPERLIAASRGETMPVADNKSDKGKAKNRRVEVVVVVPRDAAAAR